METLFDPTSTPLAVRPCGWCDDPIPEDARADAKYCSKSCRQAAHRFYRGRDRATSRSAIATTPLRLAYADPPYPGKARIYRDHPDFAGEVDHVALLVELERDFPDGWALSTSALALPSILRLDVCPDDVRVAAWHRGERSTRSHWPLSAWEPVVYRGGRQIAGDGVTTRTDSLVYHARARTTDPRRVTGAKPAEFVWWLFDLLGAAAIDELVDVFPGSGGVARAFKAMREGAPAIATRRVVDAGEGDT
jgi:hypothetical protein